MPVLYKIIIIIFCIFVALFATDISQLIDDGYIIVDTDNEQEYEDILQRFTENPLIWNYAKVKDVDVLPINEFLKNSIVFIIKKREKIDNWNELQRLSGFSDDEMSIIKLFFVLKEQEHAKVKIYDYNVLSIDEKPLITKNSIRIKMITPKGWNFSGITERDLNERDLFDHYNFSARSPMILDKTEILFGSFRFRWGNGLFFDSNPMRMINNSGSASLLRSGADFYNYSGSDENNYLFGIANKISLPKFVLYSFYSNHKIDCRIENGEITSLTNTGYHVSDIEVKYKNRLNSHTYGLASIYDMSLLKIGLMHYRQTYDYPLQFWASNRLFSGTSMVHEINFATLSINGEFALSENRNVALTETFHYRLEKLNFGMSYRYLEPDFHSIYGSLQREYGSWLQNEKGFYYYFGARVNETINFSLFTDFFQRIEPANDGELIDSGTNCGIYLKKRWKNIGDLELKMSRKSDDINLKNTYNAKVKTRIVNRLYFYNRYVYTTINYSGANSFGQGLNSYLKYNNTRTSVSLGSTYYFSNHPDCRIYLYEPGIPMKFNLASLSGSGQNYFLALEQKVNPNTTIYFATKMQMQGKEDKYLLQLQLLVAL